jgi:predicted CoA-binding protein
MKATIADIEKFFELKNIAMVGVSRNPKDFSRNLYRDFLNKGYNIIPVNPNLNELDGHTCYSTVSQLPVKIDGVIVMTPLDKTSDIVLEAASTGVHYIWIYDQKGFASLDKETIEMCQKSGITIIAGACPYMFFEDSAWFHKFHGWLLKISGKYPN